MDNTGFCRVIDGWEVLDELEKLEVHEKTFRPIKEVCIQNITIHANPLAPWFISDKTLSRLSSVFIIRALRDWRFSFDILLCVQSACIIIYTTFFSCPHDKMYWHCNKNVVLLLKILYLYQLSTNNDVVLYKVRILSALWLVIIFYSS